MGKGLAALRNPVSFPVLIELGADPEAVYGYGKTPADYAVDSAWLEGWDVFQLNDDRGTVG